MKCRPTDYPDLVAWYLPDEGIVTEDVTIEGSITTAVVYKRRLKDEEVRVIIRWASHHMTLWDWVHRVCWRLLQWWKHRKISPSAQKEPTP